MDLNNFDKIQFLEQYWQKKPLLIRNAFEQPFWLEADELAGLACEEEAEARIIIQENECWNVECGPFEEARFATLPESHWTLLIQAVDQWVPQVQDIIDSFDFLPSWRLDDIMVSYAPIGGTVSQHYDFFDVFLIQGKGSRKWQVGEICGSHSELLPDTPVRILKDFNPVLEYVLQPGDVLYIPAKHSHKGVSLEDSLTYSVGFRAPSIRDIVDGVATTALESLKEDDRYQDCAQSLTANKGEIPEIAIKQLQEMLLKSFSDTSAMKEWIGRYVTERKYPEHDISADETEGWQTRVIEGEGLYKNPSSRLAYSGQSLFVDGESYQVPLELAEMLSNTSAVDPLFLFEYVDSTVINQLVVAGVLVFGMDE